MHTEELKFFTLSYLCLMVAIICAAADFILVAGVLTGITIFLRSLGGPFFDPSSAVIQIQKMPKWKWFSVIYLSLIMVWLLLNLGEDYIYQINSVLATLILFFPFIVPYVINEYKIYKRLKYKAHKK